MQKKLRESENPGPFPEQANTLNDSTFPILQDLVFPALFPFGEGDASNRDSHSEVTMKNSNRNFLKHAAHKVIKQSHVCPFAAHARWTHWTQNSAARHRVNSKKMCV